MVPTSINFPSPKRIHWSCERREEEVKRWHQQMQDPEWRGHFSKKVLDKSVKRWNQQEAEFYEKLSCVEWRLGSRLVKIPGIKSFLRQIAPLFGYRPL
jgi:hypothetical protein